MLRQARAAALKSDLALLLSQHHLTHRTDMKTSLACLTLLLAVILAVSGFPMERKGGAGGRGKERAVQYAAWEDVNVIAHGLLQLGQGLKEHVDKTKMQMRDISAHMKALDASVSRLGEEGQKLREKGEQLQARVQGLEQRGQEEEGQEERRRVEERMRRLEEKVDGMMQGEGLTDIAPGNGNYTEALQVGRTLTLGNPGDQTLTLGNPGDQTKTLGNPGDQTKTLGNPGDLAVTQ